MLQLLIERVFGVKLLLYLVVLDSRTARKGMAEDELAEASTEQGVGVVGVPAQRVDLDRCLSGGRQRAVGALALRVQAADRALVARQVLAAVLALEFREVGSQDALVGLLSIGPVGKGLQECRDTEVGDG